MTVTAMPLADRLAAARRDEQDLNRQLQQAEAALELAVSEGRYGDAEKLRADADAIREPLLIARAHAQALQAGMDELDRHRQEEQRLVREREARERAAAEHDAAIEAQREATEEAQRLWAELEPAYQALRQILEALMAVDGRLFAAQQAWHGSGVASGRLHPDWAAPTPSRAYATRLQANPMLAAVLARPRLF